ncbi:MAG: glycosyltransferase family 4 protein, partial [Bacteroidales bacterium]
YISKRSKLFPLRAAYVMAKKMKKIGSRKLFFCDNKDMSLCCWAKIFNPSLRLFYQQHMQIGVDKKDWLHTHRYQYLDKWISPLNYLAEEVKQKTNIDPQKIVCIPLGVDIQKLLAGKLLTKIVAQSHWHLSTNRPVIGILGRLDRLKNQHIVIEAVHILKQRNIFVDLLIVGEPTREKAQQVYAHELIQQVIDSQLESQVSFHPFTDQITNFYKALDLFVMATDCETYGMVTLEAMLCGVPVLASNAGGSPEILQNGKYGSLFQPSNAQDLANKMIYILENKELIIQKAELANEYVSLNFDMNLEVQKIHNLVNN